MIGLYEKGYDRRFDELLALGFYHHEVLDQIFDDRLRAIRRARQAGATTQEIARALGLSKGRVHRLNSATAYRSGRQPLQSLVLDPIPTAAAAIMAAYLAPDKKDGRQPRPGRG